MPVSQAAIDGIEKNGLAWRRKINLGEGIAEMAALNDAYAEGEDTDYAKMEEAALKVAARLRELHEKTTWARDLGGTLNFQDLAEELEAVADETLDDVNEVMERVYNVCDFQRIVINNQ